MRPWLLVAVLLVAAGCDQDVPTIETVPDTVAISLVAPPTSATVAMLAEPATTEVEITSPASVVDTAVRLEPPETTAPAPTTTVFTWARYDCWSFVPLLEKYGLPVAHFMKIMQRESHCDPDVRCNINEACRSAVDDSIGLTQLNTKGGQWSNPGGLAEMCGLEFREQLYDPDTNIRCASLLYAKYGTKPWRTG